MTERALLCGRTPRPPEDRITKLSMGTERWVGWKSGQPPRRRRRAALIVGDEQEGISPQALAVAEAAVAALGIVLYEAARRRSHPSDANRPRSRAT